MFLPNSVKIFIASAPADMRRSHNGLSGLVRQQFTESILSGHLFVFYNKRKDRIKILFYDRGGLALYYKKLARGKYCLPDMAGHSGPLSISSAQLNLILAGFDPSDLRAQKLWLPVAG
jgi:transposase